MNDPKVEIRLEEEGSRNILSLRTRYRLEMNCQIVHDSIHRRPGWTRGYLLSAGEDPAGFATVAIGGPWKQKPTFLEFYLLPAYRTRAFEFFEAFLSAGQPEFLEVQSNDTLATVMALTYGREIATEKIVFQDNSVTFLSARGATMRQLTGDAEIRECLEERQGVAEWSLEIDGRDAAKGGILFHYNRPYADLSMEVNEEFRRRGLGSYLVQELKRVCYQFGAVPAARCSPENVASRRTLQRAGLAPFAHILNGRIQSAITQSQTPKV